MSPETISAPCLAATLCAHSTLRLPHHAYPLHASAAMLPPCESTTHSDNHDNHQRFSTTPTNYLVMPSMQCAHVDSRTNERFNFAFALLRLQLKNDPTHQINNCTHLRPCPYFDAIIRREHLRRRLIQPATPARPQHPSRPIPSTSIDPSTLTEAIRSRKPKRRNKEEKKNKKK